MPHLILYTRNGCHLCEKTKQELQQLRETLSFTFEEMDIAQSDQLTELYGLMIPVLLIDGEEAGYGQIDVNQVSERLQEKNTAF